MSDAPNTEPLLAPSDIADLAGVSRGAVSNWRNRGEGFPEPTAGTAARPLFNLSEVVAWLRANGKEMTEKRYDLRMWSAMNALRGELTPEDMGTLAIAMACACKMLHDADGEKGLDEFAESVTEQGLRILQNPPETVDRRQWRALVPANIFFQQIPTAPAVRAVYDAVRRIPVEELADAADFVLERVSSAQLRAGAESGFVGSRSAKLLAALASRHPVASTIYDPTCGVGVSLLSATDASRAAGHPYTRIVGHDVSEFALTTATQRAYLRGVDVEFVLGDVLAEDPDPALRADLVVAEPPFGLGWNDQNAFFDSRWHFGTPPPKNADLAWPQHAVAHLAPGGRAYLLMTMGSLFRTGREQQIRAELLRQGCIESVIALPPRMLPHTSIPISVWVLCLPGESRNPGWVTVVDGSDVTHPEDEITNWLDLPDESTVPHANVTSVDILAADADLNPHRWLQPAGPDPDEVAAVYCKGLISIDTTIEHLDAVQRPLRVFPGAGDTRIIALGDLAEQKVLDVKRWPTSRPPEDDPLAVSPGDLRTGTLPRASGTVDDPRLTRPGDILVTTHNGIHSLIDHDGGHRIYGDVHIIRVLTDYLLPEYVAATVAGQWNDRVSNQMAAGPIRRARLRDLEIPLIPLKDQQKFLEALASLREVEALAHRLSEDVKNSTSALLNHVRYPSTT